MATTRATLIGRLKHRSDAEAWREFHALYTPLLYRYARGKGLSRADAEEVRDQCLEVVVRKIPKFEYDKKKGGFKNWLYRIASRKVCDLFRKHRERLGKSKEFHGLFDPHPTPDEEWERQWEYQLVRYCVEQVRGSVSERSYQVFHMLVFEDCTVPEVCGRLGMNSNQVYKAKSRVLHRVRRKRAELEADMSL